MTVTLVWAYTAALCLVLCAAFIEKHFLFKAAGFISAHLFVLLLLRCVALSWGNREKLRSKEEMEQLKKKGDEEADERWDFANRLLLHIDDLFHFRINIFLVAEALLFAALATAWNSPGNISFNALVCSLGLIFTLVLGYTIMRLDVGLGWLVTLCQKLEKSGVYESYGEIGKGQISAARFYHLLPLTTALVWLVLLWFVSGWKEVVVSVFGWCCSFNS